jgi:hypothetical protein
MTMSKAATMNTAFSARAKWPLSSAAVALIAGDAMAQAEKKDAAKANAAPSAAETKAIARKASSSASPS